MKSVRIWSYSDPYFPIFGVNIERYGVHFSRNEKKKLSETKVHTKNALRKCLPQYCYVQFQFRDFHKFYKPV